MKKLVLLVLCLLIVIAAMIILRRPGTTPGPDAAEVARNNHGVGLMGRFDYSSALVEFEALLADRPDWNDVRVNAAIAQLNRQDEGDSEAALARLEAVLAADPGHPTARYCTGLLRLYLQSPEAALPHFQVVTDADPGDAYAAYYVGQCLTQQQDYEGALPWLERARAADPYLRSAYYALQQAYRRLGREDEAAAAQEAFFKLENNPRARLVEFKYTRMGPKGQAIVVDVPDVPPALPAGLPFGDSTPLVPHPPIPSLARYPDGRPASIVPVDLDGDDDLDLLLSGVSGDAGLWRSVVLMNNKARGFEAIEHPLGGVPDVRTALAGDFDNDGRTDVYLCRRGRNLLWRRDAEGRWADVTETTGTGNGEHDTVDGAFVDADHDGDLDLFCVNGDGPDELLNNNRDGTFRPIAAEQDIDGGDRASTQVLFADLDRDRDLDILVIHAEPPHAVYLNDRLWSYTPAPGVDDLTAAPIAAAAVADLDADGTLEIVTATAGGPLREWRRDGTGSWRAGGSWPGRPVEVAGGVQLAVADFTGDGALEVLDSRADGFCLHPGRPDRTALLQEVRPPAGVEGAAPLNLRPGEGPSVVVLSGDGGPQEFPPGPGRSSFTDLRFSGGDDPGQSMRTNASGIGAQLAVRVGSRWTMTSTLRAGSGPGQGLQPLALGLGGAIQADFISIDWPDGVFQSEVALAERRMHDVPETQRQLSSCPVLFTWDGGRYRFVSDVLGVGGVGFAVAPGVYAEPRPWERFLLPVGALAPRAGRFALKLGEPMEEAMYLDAARLVAWDVPPGWSMVLDERFAIGGPAPTGEPRFFRRQATPTHAVNDRDADVTAAVRDVDDVAAPVGSLDRRFIGRLAADHVLILTFAEDLAAGPGAPLLVADGWIEYPYSQTMFAAWQAGADYRAPTIEAEGADGRWRVVLDQFGYPAGMPRRMSVPLAGLPPGTRRLRITTNQEIYWDALAVAWSEPCPGAARRPLPLLAADVRARGFPRRIDHPQRRPDYDYDDRVPFWDTRHQAGRYSAFGSVEPLVTSTDDAVAIIGPGEEIHLEFAADLPGPDAGWTRRLVLEADGWCKDMDLFTRDGETVGPLPSRGPAADATRVLHDRFNTRYRSGP